METEVVDKTETGLATVDLDAFGDGGLSSQDIVIPKVLAMQGLSALVTDTKHPAKFGDLVSSLDKTVIGNVEDAPLEFIPFYLHKTWIVSKLVGKKFVFDHIEDVTPANENKKWEEVSDGQQWKNEKSLNFYSILPSDPSLPYIVQFKGTSSKAGRELATQMYVKNKASKLTPAGKVMSLKGSIVSNDNGTYVVLGTEVSRTSTEGEVGNCLEWFSTIKGGKTKADEEQF